MKDGLANNVKLIFVVPAIGLSEEEKSSKTLKSMINNTEI